MIGQETLSLASAIGGLIGALGGFFAAFAAFRSAGTAKTAVRQAAESEQRRLFGLVVETAQKVVTEHMRVAELAQRLKREYRDLFTFAGQSGGTRLKVYLDGIEKTEKEVTALERNASEWLLDAKTRKDIPEDEVAELLFRFNGDLGRLRVAKEGFKEDLASVETQNRAYRERALSRTS